MHNNHIDYIEFKTTDIDVTKTFYTKVFGWKFTDFGEAYTVFDGGGVNGGFELTEEDVTSGALVVLYHDDLLSIKFAIVAAGGRISKEIFSFPSGHQFHFIDPTGNELAIWSDTYSE